MHIFAWSPSPYARKYCRRPMVTPTYRFQQLESMLIDPRGRFDAVPGRYLRGRRWSNRPRLPRLPDEMGVAHPCPQTSSSSVPSNSTSHENEAEPSSSPASGSPPHRNTLPDNFNRFQMAGWNWGLWICFIIVTALLVPAHLYLKQYAYRGELMGIFFIITLLFLVCFSVSMFHTKTRAILLHRLRLEEELQMSYSLNNNSTTSSSQPERISQFSSTQTASQIHRGVRASVSTPELQLVGERRLGPSGQNSRNPQTDITRSASQASRSSDVSHMWDPSWEPPPYEIAILLPTPSPEGLTRTCETPPPAYEVIQ